MELKYKKIIARELLIIFCIGFTISFWEDYTKNEQIDNKKEQLNKEYNELNLKMDSLKNMKKRLDTLISQKRINSEIYTIQINSIDNKINIYDEKRQEVMSHLTSIELDCLIMPSYFTSSFLLKVLKLYLLRWILFGIIWSIRVLRK